MAEGSGKEKKVMILIIVAVLIPIAAGSVLWIRKQKEFPKDLNGDGYLKDYQVGSKNCIRLFDSHEKSFDVIVETVKRQSKELFYTVGFNNIGQFYVQGELKYDEDFVEAMNDIYTDEIFRWNPHCAMHIQWYETYGWFIDFTLYETTYSYGGIKYTEKPREYKDPDTQVDLDENWYWYEYGAY